jgi:pimeloyl-ACP methyl ester carboxylesterase
MPDVVTALGQRAGDQASEGRGSDALLHRAGAGVPVVFVHGSVADHRTWDAQRDPTARKYRYIAYDQRYFRPAPWPDDGKRFSLATHANDLAVFLRQLDVGPAHLVGWSYGADVVFVLAGAAPRACEESVPIRALNGHGRHRASRSEGRQRGQ